MPLASYTNADPKERAMMRAMWNSEIKELEKKSEERKATSKRTFDDVNEDTQRGG